MSKEILCSISTRGRYFTTLPLVLQAVVMQTKLPDKLIIFDDNVEPKDVRDVQEYQYLFLMMQEKGLEWEWAFAEKKGQHFNHQKANLMGYTWVWRVDDDSIPEPDVLEKLYAQTGPDVGAVGGSILTPPFHHGIKATGKIEDVKFEPNLQWDYISETKEVDHLHCSFLYRAGVHDYNLALSRIAHREETLFTYGIKQKGYKILITPAITWHQKNRKGGIRDGDLEMFQHDEAIFDSVVKTKDRTIVILDNGLGDHIVFKHVLPYIKNPLVFSCYNDVVPGRSIQDAKDMFGDIEGWNIYRKMDEWNWKGSLEDAFKKLYNVNSITNESQRFIAKNNVSSNNIIIAPFAKGMRNGELHPKNYPYWPSLITLLQNAGYNVIQVGIGGETQLVPDFRKNLTLEQLAELTLKAKTWISVDSFFQHFAWDLGVTGISLFGQSDPNIFGHPENVNLLKDRKYLREKQFWMWEQCTFNPDAFVKPEVVLEAIKNYA